MENHQLLDPAVTNHSSDSIFPNIHLEFTRVSSQPPHTLREESSTLLPDSVTILEEQPFIMHSPNIPYPIMRSTHNFPSKSDDVRNIDDKGNDNVNEVDEDNINDNDEGVQLRRHFLGQMDVVCIHCSALQWKDEQLSKSSIIKPLFGQWCLQGKIKVPYLDALPNEFKDLYDDNGLHSRSFGRYIQEYNTANAFKSLRIHMDNQLAHGRGPTSFVIHSELHHRIGVLVPNEEHEASYAQLYVYNPGASLNTHHKRNLHLNKDVLKVIQGTLVRCKLFNEFYRHAYEELQDAAGDNVNLNVPAYLHYSVSTDHHRYNLPSTNEIVVILPGEGPEISSMKNIIVYRKAN
ncbi:hypothetical protein GIB67_035634 [Kingdonia uniflora]|uniref:Uncharacterized protein n=1 Tax=Kingdonia uniflora TaxID=39325 RepID=A0A7J7LL01_9MAGN|nr:hypothetical protein GIB67_035634 [Kingdonia uniflora]